tara:strand:- start:998 stop:1642 length:645 start_codon:yes stop_codon:yes gene_type:complete
LKYYIINKYLAALSGLFLILFLTGHLAGNLQLLIPESSGAQQQFNDYAAFMSSNPVVKILSITTYVSILLHVVVTVALSIDSKRKRGVGYSVSRSPSNSISSRYMGVLGTVILAFIIIHLSDFWYKAKFEGETDVYSMVVNKFQNIEYVAIYVVAMLAIFFHTLHGFSSSFQSLGLVGSKTRRYIKICGMIYSLLIPLLFMLIPIYLFLNLHKT